jgi:hypothetical protein
MFGRNGGSGIRAAIADLAGSQPERDNQSCSNALFR